MNLLFKYIFCNLESHLSKSIIRFDRLIFYWHNILFMWTFHREIFSYSKIFCSSNKYILYLNKNSISLSFYFRYTLAILYFRLFSRPKIYRISIWIIESGKQRRRDKSKEREREIERREKGVNSRRGNWPAFHLQEILWLMPHGTILLPHYMHAHTLYTLSDNYTGANTYCNNSICKPAYALQCLIGNMRCVYSFIGQQNVSSRTEEYN